MGTLSISSLETLDRTVSVASRPLCLYSGGLDGTYLLRYLAKRGLAEVVALTVDLGGDLDRAAVEEVCQILNVRSVILDKRREFADGFVIPAIAAQAVYLGGHPICASLSRPLMARVACDAANENDCDIIIHTSNRSQNSLRRFNGALAAQPDFMGHFGSPFEHSAISREAKIRDLRQAGIRGFNQRLYSTDSNFWGREFESGRLDDPEDVAIDFAEPLYQWTKVSSAQQGETISVTFENGVPTQLDAVPMNFVSLVGQLNVRVGRYGLGRYIGLEEIEDGNKVQEVREMPAAFLLFDAYRRLESCVVSADCIREKMHIEQLWVREAVEGRWFGVLRAAAQDFVCKVAEGVSGTVTYRLDAGSLQLVSLRTERPLYIRDRRTYEEAGQMVRVGL